jgi:hypothetical protein
MVLRGKEEMSERAGTALFPRSHRPPADKLPPSLPPSLPPFSQTEASSAIPRTRKM